MIAPVGRWGGAPAATLWATATGGRLNPSNVRNRLLAEAVKRANERRAARGKMLLPDGVTPHTLRAPSPASASSPAVTCASSWASSVTPTRKKPQFRSRIGFATMGAAGFEPATSRV